MINNKDKVIKKNVKVVNGIGSTVVPEVILSLSNRKIKSTEQLTEKKERISAEIIRNKAMEIEKKNAGEARLDYGGVLLRLKLLLKSVYPFRNLPKPTQHTH